MSIRVNPVPGDNWSNLQGAVAAVLGAADPATTVRIATDSIELGPGDFWLSAPWVVAGAQGLEIWGAGGATRLRPQFTGLAAVDLNGCARCTVRDLWIEGTGKEQLTYGLYLRWDGIQRRSTSTNRLANLHIAATRYETGIQIGQPGLPVQCDLTSMEAIELDGAWSATLTQWWQKGLCVGSSAWGNNYAHRCSELSVAGHARNLSVEVSGIVVSGGGLGQGGVDIWAETGSYLRIEGLECQGSQRLFQSAVEESAMMVTLADVFWKSPNLPPDGQWIQWGAPGVLRLTNLQVNLTKVAPQIVQNGLWPQQVQVDGLFVGGGYTQAQVFQNGAHGSSVVRGYVQTDAAGRVVSVT